MRIATTKSMIVGYAGLAVFIGSLVMKYMRTAEFVELALRVVAIILMCFVSPAFRRDDGIDWKKIAYSKRDRSKKRLWSLSSNLGLIMYYAGIVLAVVCGFRDGGFNAITVMQWGEVGILCATGMLLMGVSGGALTALAHAAAHRETPSATI